jgi:hypothetical protein
MPRSASITETSPLVTLGYILGGSLIVAVMLVGITMFQIKNSGDSITVTGSAKMQVTSDQAKWITQTSRSIRESELKAGYASLASDLATVRAFFAAEGIPDDQLTVSPVSMNEVYQQDQSAEKRYNLIQTFTVQSSDVQALTAAANHAATVVGKGVIFSTIALEYYYSKLPDARIALLSQAIDDAKARVKEIAKTSGRGVGSLKGASSGVVQVQSLNSTDVADYGTYDTSQIEKQITVTVKATFSLR